MALGSPCRRRPHRHRRLHPGSPIAARPGRHRQQCAQPERARPRRPRPRPLSLFVRGSGFNEARHNGTPYQTNGTRLWRYATGADWQNARSAALALRLYGSDEHYRQTFSSISNLPNFGDPTCTYRCGETPSKFSLRPRQRARRGRALEPAPRRGPAAGGRCRRARRPRLGPRADLHRHRRTHQSRRPSARLRRLRRSHVGRTKPGRSTASARMDWFQNYDGHETQWNGSSWTPTAAQPPQRDAAHLRSAPRPLAQAFRALGALRLGLPRLSRAHAQRALPLHAGRQPAHARPTATCSASAPPAGKRASPRERAWGSIRASYFLTQVNRPIAAVTINPTSSPILLMRENLGQIESRGVSLDFELAPRSGSPSTAATSTRTPPSRAARRISATGFPKSRATWPR